ncbi:MAG: TonB-dependent receptor, partial [Ignavibacteriales bacterium]|nr:TonB-dependent receptor [Ignavibacteriales bacterium]
EGWFYDFGYRYYSNSAMWKINFFLNTLTNMVVETPGFTYQNRPATQMVNFGSAKIYGLDLAFELHIIKDLILYGRGSIVRGEDTKKTEDLPFMPGDNGTLGLRAKAHEYVDISLEIEGVMDQNKVAPSEKRTGGYSLVNMMINIKPVKIAYGELVFTLGVDNILDRLYLSHLSTNRGLVKAEPGRNIFIRANYNFK